MKINWQFTEEEEQAHEDEMFLDHVRACQAEERSLFRAWLSECQATPVEDVFPLPPIAYYLSQEEVQSFIYALSGIAN